MNKNINNKNDLWGQYCDKKGRLPLVMLENQIRENIDGGNDFKVRFVLFVLGVLLCLTMKLFVKRLFLHFLEDTNSINKLNWAELVLSHLTHEIQEFKSNKQSGVFGCLFFFMVMSLVLIIFYNEFGICYKMWGKLSICLCKLILQLFYYEHILVGKKNSLLWTRGCPRICAWGDNELLQMKRIFKKLSGYVNPNVCYIDQFGCRFYFICNGF